MDAPRCRSQVPPTIVVAGPQLQNSNQEIHIMSRKIYSLTFIAAALVLFAGNTFASNSCQPTGGCMLLTNGPDMYTGTSAGECVGGAGGADQMNGGGGDDVLFGGADIDLINGQDGDDCLYGGPARDVLTGGNGDDLLDGGNDGVQDVLIGGPGTDCCLDEGLASFC